MPSPTDANSSDAYLYNNFLNPLAKNLCFIHPNYVTIANMGLIIPLVYSILNRWSFSIFIIIIFVRALLDCLDGAIARACNTTSKLGALLDRIGDSTALISVSLSIVYFMYLKHGKNMFIIMFIFMAVIFGSIVYANNKIDNGQELEGIYGLIHDNYVLTNVAGASVLWLYIHYYLLF